MAGPPAKRLGVLSQTIIQNPSVEQILTGRVRSEDHNDLVFVGTHSVRVDAYDCHDRFTQIAARTDFASQIRAAIILGKDAAADDNKPKPRIHLSPHIILLALDFDLLFLKLLDHGSAPPTFHIIQHPMPFARSTYQRPGKFLAVDPLSRAFAVASFSGTVFLYSLNGREQWADDVLSIVAGVRSLDVDMIVTLMDFIYPSPKDPDNTLHLLVIGHKDSKLKFKIYSWSHEVPFATAPFVTQQISGGGEYGWPCLLIPLAQTPGSFIIVGDTGQMVIFKDAHIGSLAPSSGGLSHPDPEPERYKAHLNSRPPLWTGWAKSRRWFEKSDWVVICREDGAVRFLWVGTHRETINGPSFQDTDAAQQRNVAPHIIHDGSITHLESNIRHAFTIFDPEEGRRSHKYPQSEQFIFAGDGCDGGHYVIGETKVHPVTEQPVETTPMVRDVYYNWAPVRDLAVIRDEGRRPRQTLGSDGFVEQGPSKTWRDRVFCTSGQEPWGAVCELRYGYELLISLRTGDEEPRFVATTAAWPLQSTRNPEHRFVLISSPLETEIVSELSAEDEVGITQVCESPSIAACMLDQASILSLSQEIRNIDLTVLVTPGDVKLFRIEPNVCDLSMLKSWPLQNIVVATVHSSSASIVVAQREGSAVKLYCKRIVFLDDDFHLQDIGQPLTLDFEPICARMFAVKAFQEAKVKVEQGAAEPEKVTHVALGSESDIVTLFGFEVSAGLRQEHQIEFRAEAACESIDFVRGSSGESPGTLVCGFRNGTFGTAECYFQMGILQFQQPWMYSVGETSVRVWSSSEHVGGCFLYEGTGAYYLDFRKDSKPVISSVWLTEKDKNKRSLKQPSIQALCLSGKSICCIAGGELFVGDMGSVARPLPRRMLMPGSPTRLIYSNRLKSLVAVSTVTSVDESTSTRANLSTITILDPNRGVSKKFKRSKGLDHSSNGEEGSGVSYGHYTCKPGERICSIAEWEYYTEEGKPHHFLIVGIETEKASGQRSGIIRVLRASTPGEGKAVLEPITRRDHQESHAVWAICQFGSDSFIYCCGNEIRKRTLRTNTQEARFDKSVLHSMGSKGTFISSNGSRVYVTTGDGSTIVLDYNAETESLRQVACDSKARNGIAHLALEDTELVLSSDQHQGITGIRVPASAQQHFATVPYFEAKLAQSVTRFFKASIRPPWRKTRLTGVLERDILATTEQGGVYGLTILGEALWRLCRFLQNMCLRHARICPQLNTVRWSKTHIEPDATKPEGFSVDGDVLRRLVDEEDAAAVINQMLDCTPIDNSSTGARTDYDSADARRARFIQLVDEAFSNDTAEAADAVESARIGMTSLGGDSVERALQHLRLLLEVPF